MFKQPGLSTCQSEAANRQPRRLVLASLSPRRKELLGYLGITFEVVPSNIDEHWEANLTPEQVAVALSIQKAQVVKDKILEYYPIEERRVQSERLVVLAADTIVVIGSSILGKPLSKQNAYDMLLQLSGQVHAVYTGVAVISFVGKGPDMVLHSEWQKSLVHMRALDPVEISAYLATDEPMDKAGAYAVQGTAGAFIEKIDGCLSNVIGLPMTITVNLLREAGIKILGR